jgi:5'-nucleotidase
LEVADVKLSRTARRMVAVIATTVVATMTVTGTAAAGGGGGHGGGHHPKPPAPKPTAVRILSVNDFHGNLEPPTGSSGTITLSDGTTKVLAGGAAYLATAVKAARSEVRNSMLVAAGDLIGASPLASALFHDEPTIDFFNYLKLQASAVGNHEFDEGFAELKRMQTGGCHPVDGCQFEPTFRGADFPYLGSNVYYEKNNRLAMKPFTVRIVGGVPIGIIGATLEGVPDVVTPTAIAGLKFGDEAAAINRTSKLLSRVGIKVQIVVMHQGDNVGTGPGHGPNDCADVTGPASDIAEKVSPAVDAIFTGHSHLGYNCMRPDPAGNLRPVTQGSSFGRLLTVADFSIDPRTHDVIRSATKVENRIVVRSVTPDAGAQAIVDSAVTKSAPIANRQVGTITTDITRAAGASGESALGDVIADAQLAATTGNGAVVAITNPGGIRTDLTYASSPAGEGDGVVTYGEAFAVQPFSNIMQTITLTGADLDAVLEQQYSGANQTVAKVLQISASMHYTLTPANAPGDKISNITINGVAVDPAAGYRVSVNNFLAAGGDGFGAFTNGTDLTGGPVDVDAFTAYLTAHSPVAPPPLDRITVA